MDEVGNLRNFDGEALPDARVKREVKRFAPEIERPAGGDVHLFRFDGDRAIDCGDAVRERQTDHGTPELGIRVDGAKRIEGFREAVE